MAVIDCIEKGLNKCYSFLPQSKPSKQKTNAARLIAHRGAHNNKSSRFENTHAAFEKAQAVGCWGIEFDVHATKDKVLIVNHDPTLLRLWHIEKPIEELTLEELRVIAPQIPTLAEVIERYGKKMHLFIELKAPFNSEQALAHDLRFLQPEVDYHLLSLEEPLFAAMSLFIRPVMLLVAGHNNAKEFCRLSLQKNYGGVLGHYLLLNESKIKRLRKAHQKVGVGFVDSRYSLYRELNRGIEWVFSNEAERVSVYLKELNNDYTCSK